MPDNLQPSLTVYGKFTNFLVNLYFNIMIVPICVTRHHLFPPIAINKNTKFGSTQPATKQKIKHKPSRVSHRTHEIEATRNDKKSYNIPEVSKTLYFFRIWNKRNLSNNASSSCSAAAMSQLTPFCPFSAPVSFDCRYVLHYLRLIIKRKVQIECNIE